MATPTALPASFTAGQVLTAAQQNGLRGAFRVLQVVSTTLTTTFSSASAGAFVNVTGLSASITPSATTSKILIMATVNGGTFMAVKVTGGDTATLLPNNSASMDSAGNNDFLASATILLLDSPASVASVTYQIQSRDIVGGSTFINRSQNSATAVTSSTITVMEISA